MAMRFSIQERGKGARIEIPSHGSIVDYVEPEAISDALTKIHSGDEEVDYVALGYKSNSTKEVELKSFGSGGVEEAKQFLDEKTILYFLFRVIDVYDDIPTTRFAFVTWIGERLSGVKKARMATNKSDILSVIGHYNVELIVSTPEEFNQEDIDNKIADGSGSRVRVVSTKKTQKTSKSGTKAGYASGLATTKQVVEFPDRETLEIQLTDVRDDLAEINWCLFGYEGVAEIVSKGTGSGGIDEMRDALDDSDAFYGLLRVNDVIDKSDVVRFVYVVFVGENVKPMRRGKLVSHKGSLDEVFQPYHFVIYITDPEDLSDELIQEKLAELKK